MRPVRHLLHARQLPFAATAAMATALSVVALPAQPALASDTLTVTSANNGGVSNTGSATLDFHTTDAWAGPPTVTISRVGAPSDSYTTSPTNPSSFPNPTDLRTVEVTFDFTLANPGTYRVDIMGPTSNIPPTSGTSTDSCGGCVVVNPNGPAPQVTSLSQAMFMPGGSAGTWTITGQNFAKGPYTQCTAEPCHGPSIEVQIPGATPKADTQATIADTSPSATAATATTITKQISFSANDPTGPRNIIVYNSDGQAGTFAGPFTLNAAMTVSKLSPSSLPPGGSAPSIVVTGTNFPSDVQAEFRRNGSTTATSDVTIGGVNVDSPTQITLNNVSVSSSAPVGGQDLRLTSPSNSTTFVAANAFHVSTAPSPTGVVYSSNPASPGKTDYGQGAQTVILTVSGSNFVADNGPSSPGARASFTPASTDIQIIKETATTTAVNVTMSIAPNAALTSYGINVANPGGPSVACSSGPVSNTCMLTIGAAPTINSNGISPPSLGEGRTSTLTISGNNFDTGSAPAMAIQDVTVNSETAGSATSFMAGVKTGTTPGRKDVTLTNRSDHGQSTCSQCFAVDVLQVDTVSPASALNTGPVNVAVTGSSFDPANLAVALQQSAGSGHDAFQVTGSILSTPAPTATTFSASFPLAGVDPGSYHLVATNTGATNAGSGTCACSFAVIDQNSGPAVSSVSPSSVGAGTTNQTLTINGTDFYPHSTVSFSFPQTSSAAVKVDSVSYVSATQLVAVVDATSSGVTPQSGTLTVTNTDGKSGSTSFSVNPSLAMSSTTNPTSVAWTSPPFTLTLYTNNAQSGGTVQFGVNGDFTAATGLSTTSTTTVGAPDQTTPPGFTQNTTVNVKVDSTTVAIRSYDIKLTDPDGGVATCSACFSVTKNPPAKPTGVKATAGDTQATVTWTAPSSAGDAPIDSYTVTSNPDGKTATVTGQGANPPPTTATVTGLTNGTAYTFTVVAHSNAGTSQPSDPSSPVTPFGAPGKPTNVAGTPGVKQVSLTWTAPSNNGSRIDKYTITTSPGGGTTTVNAPDSSHEAPTSGTVTGLTAGTAYTFTVTAHNAAGDGAASDPSAPVTPYDKPGAPTNVQGVPGNERVTLSWTAAPKNGARIDHYTITTSPGGGTTTVSAADSSSDAPTSGTVTGLTNGTPYTFTVTANNAAGDGPASSPSSPVTPVAKPNAPTNVTATAGDQKATVTWTAPTPPTGDMIKDYVVQTNPNGPTKTVQAGTTTADISPLTNGTAYTFTVVAEFVSGSSSESTPSNSVTPFGKPLAPTAVAATASGSGSATVTWTAAKDNGSPITGYTVTATPGGMQQKVGGSATSATVSGLTNGTSYTFTVTATNKAGDSPQSAASNAVVPQWTTTVSTGSKVTIVGGHSTTISGVLRRSDGTPISGAALTISRRSGSSSSFVQVTTVTTGSDGSWSLSVRPAMHTTYLISYAGDAADSASSGQQVVLVRSAVSLTSPRSGSTVRHGTIHFTAVVVDAVVGTRGSLLYRKSDGTWHTLATATVNSQHRLLFSRSLGRGTLVLRAMVNKTAYDFSGTSRTITLHLS